MIEKIIDLIPILLIIYLGLCVQNLNDRVINIEERSVKLEEKIK